MNTLPFPAFRQRASVRWVRPECGILFAVMQPFQTIALAGPTCTLRLELSRPVWHDTEDTLVVPVELTFPIGSDPLDYPAIVQEDVTNDDGIQVYDRGQEISNWTDLNIQQIEEALAADMEDRRFSRLAMH